MSMLTIPKTLKYQMQPDFNIKLSDMCCLKMKKEPIHKWEKENNRFVAITGMRKEEGGNRKNISGCILTDKKGNITKFHPLLVVSDNWEEEFIKNEKIALCKLYLPPFNFKRTGCKFCPFAIDLQEQVSIARKYIPNELKQAELIWKPVFDEYRRLNYRLKRYEELNIFDYMEESND